MALFMYVMGALVSFLFIKYRFKSDPYDISKLEMTVAVTFWFIVVPLAALRFEADKNIYKAPWE